MAANNQIRLNNPEVEPTDAELSGITRFMAEDALKKWAIAEGRYFADLGAMIASKRAPEPIVRTDCAI